MPWTNDRVIAEWSNVPKEVLAAIGPYGDFAKQHILNDVMLRVHLRLLADASALRRRN